MTCGDLDCLRDKEHRITSLEVVTKAMAGDIKTVKDQVKILADNMGAIKWAAIGASAFYIADKIGFIKFVSNVVLR